MTSSLMTLESETERRSPTVEVGDEPGKPKPSESENVGELAREASGRVVPLNALAGAGMRLPYSSPRLRGPSDGGGAPIPKLPRGTGTPPFLSNFAILSRKPGAVAPATVAVLGVGDVALETPLTPELRCSRAAMRSLRFVTGS